MTPRHLQLPEWIDDERSLLAYLVNRHGGHQYPEDLIDAIALVTSWTMVGISILAVVGVVLDSVL
jgi:hypothetical protein